jgi:DNA-directed RNA polymerase subunit RPC12/RpoP
MPILVSCPCGKQLRAKDEWAGKRIKCPGCGSPVIVTADTEDVPVLTEDDTPSRGEARPAKKEARREPDERPYHWIDPNSVGAQVIALSDDALFATELDEEALKSARKALAKGKPVADILEGAQMIIPFDAMEKVESNLHGRLVDVTWQPDHGEKLEVNFVCADKDSRDELMEALEDRLGWKSQVIEVGRLKASLAPLAVIGIFGFITFCFIMAAIQPESGGGGTKVVRTNWLGAIFVWVFNIFGPVGVALLGSPFVIGGVVWLVMRLRKPPLLLTLAPGRRGGKRRD